MGRIQKKTEFVRLTDAMFFSKKKHFSFVSKTKSF